MKQKDIDKCRHINLSTEPGDIVQTMALELQSVTRERIDANIEKYAKMGDAFSTAYEALDKGLKEDEEKTKKKRR